MRFIFALFAIFAIVLFVYFDRLNPGAVTINLSSSSSYDISMVGFFLFSFALGAFIIIIFTLLRDARNVFYAWRDRQRKRVEVKVQEIFSKGLYAFLSGKYDQAISFFHDIIKMEPSHFYTLLRIGDAYLKERNYAEAIKFHKKARKIDEKSLEAHFALANDYMISGSYDEAISVMQGVIKKDSSNIEALVRLRDIYVTTGRWEGAHEIQERIVKYRKDSTEDIKLLMGLRYEFAKSLYSKGDREQGEKLLRTIIKTDKNFVPAYVMLGDMLVETGDDHEAADLLESGYYMNSREILLHRLEDFYIQQGRPEKIIWVYKKAISLHPDNTLLKFYLGKLYYRLEMLDEAFEVLSELEGTEIVIPELSKLLGNIYERKEEHGKALAEFKKALGLSKRIIIPYYCAGCNYNAYEWSGRCPSCGEWNTFTVSPARIRKEMHPTSKEKWHSRELEPS